MAANGNNHRVPGVLSRSRCPAAFIRAAHRSVIAGSLAIAAMATGWAPAMAGDDLPTIKERGRLRVAVAPLSPFVVRDAEGALSGLEIDAMAALGDDLGLEIEFIERPFCELADALLEGDADMIASGFSNTGERRRYLGFSLPYHDTEYFVTVDRKASRRAKTLRGLNDKDITIGYQLGGVSGMVATGEFPGSDLKGFSSFADIMTALTAGEIDGAVMFEPYLGAARALKGRKYRVPHDFALMRTIEAYAVDPDAEELRSALNEFVIARDLEGFWDDLERKWFGDPNAIIAAPPPTSCRSAVPQG